MRGSRALLPFLLGISPLITVAALVTPIEASAQTPVFTGTGLIELIPPTGVVGDGATAVDAYFVAMNVDGSPMSGLKLKASATGGSVTEPTDMGGGLYRFSFTPTKAGAATTATISLKGKVGSTNYTRTWNVAVAPSQVRSISITTNPPQLILGQDASASIQVQITGGDATGEIAILATSGTVSNITPLGNGQYTALYTPPSNMGYPHLALLRVVDKRDPSRTYGSFALPLVGKASFPVNVAPNGRAIIKVGDKQYGPQPADASGRATVPIMVPPGAGPASVVSIAPDNAQSEQPLDLKIPESKHIALIPSPTVVPADARIGIPLRAVVYTADGKPDGAASVNFVVSVGGVTPAKHEGNGVYVATWTPPTVYSPSTATVTVSLNGQTNQSDSAQISLIGAHPAKVEVSSDPAVLAVGGNGFKVNLKVSGPDNAGIPGRTIDFAVNGAKLRGEVKDNKNGEYVATFDTTGTGPVELAALVPTPPSGNPLARVLVFPARELMPADGLSANTITIVTVDNFGYPVANVPVTLAVKQGDGALPATVTTNSNGLATVYYTAGRSNGLIAVEATSGTAIPASTAFIQATGLSRAIDLPISADAGTARATTEWTAARTELRVGREMPAMIAPPPPAAGAKAAKLAVMADTPSAAAGGNTVVRINAQDAEGKGVPGQKLDLMVSAGTVSAVTEVGGGMYQATLSIPAGSTGDVKVSVATSDGSVMSFMKLPIGNGAAVVMTPPPPPAPAEPVWGAAPMNPPPPVTPPPPAEPTWGTSQPVASTPVAPSTVPNTMPSTTPAPTTPPVEVKQPKPPRTPGDELERPWLKVRAGYALAGYKYSQQRLSAQSNLYPNNVNVPCDPDSSDCGSVISQGGSLNARVYIPNFRYIGADVAVRAVNYSVDPAPLCAGLDRPCPTADPVGDAVFDIHVLGIGRYYFDAGSSTFHVGGRLGYSSGDVHIYQVSNNSIDPNDTFINGLALGAEVGADLGPDFSLSAAITEHLGGATSPYNTQVNVDLSYAFIDNMFAGLGWELSSRKVELNSGDNTIGEVQDTLNAAYLQLGVQF